MAIDTAGHEGAASAQTDQSDRGHEQGEHCRDSPGTRRPDDRTARAPVSGRWVTVAAIPSKSV
jgi:hypothetical protein